MGGYGENRRDCAESGWASVHPLGSPGVTSTRIVKGGGCGGWISRRVCSYSRAGRILGGTPTTLDIPVSTRLVHMGLADPSLHRTCPCLLSKRGVRFLQTEEVTGQ